MALYEFYCGNCKAKFEQITSSTDPEQGKCPKCQKKGAQRLLSKFAIGGQGDLRERTMHGCHDHDPSEHHDHDHTDHDHHDDHGEA